MTQDGNKRRDACPTCYEKTGTLVSNGAPYIADDQFITLLQRMDLFRHAMVVSISFDGELQVRVFIQAVVCDRPLLIEPAVHIYRYFRCLPRCKMVTSRLFETKAFH